MMELSSKIQDVDMPRSSVQHLACTEGWASLRGHTILARFTNLQEILRPRRALLLADFSELQLVGGWTEPELAIRHMMELS
jgi:acyl-CoA hydrolase